MISLITITFNSDKTIDRTLVSVSNQKYKNFNHIIVDGKSKDNTLKITKKFNHIHRIISEKDNGIYDAFNKGIKSSKDDIIGFLNSDDIFYNKNSLKIISEAFDENTDCVFGDLIYTDNNENIKRIWKGSEYIKGAFKKGGCQHTLPFIVEEVFTKNMVFTMSLTI